MSSLQKKNNFKQMFLVSIREERQEVHQLIIRQKITNIQSINWLDKKTLCSHIFHTFNIPEGLFSGLDG